MRPLNESSIHFCGLQATDIQSFVQKNPTLGFTLILQLTGTNGSRQFDRLTKTKTVESILASMDAKGIEIYIDYLLKQVNNTSNEKSVSTFLSFSVILTLRKGIISRTSMPGGHGSSTN